MDILLSLGVDHTVGYHFVLFLVVFVFLSQVLFKPYFKAYIERINRTEGNQDHAERLIAEADDLHLEYESKARELNNEHKEIFDLHRGEALHEHDRVISEAQAQAQAKLDELKAQIQTEANKARAELSGEVPAMSQIIVNQVAGKELIQ